MQDLLLLAVVYYVTNADVELKVKLVNQAAIFLYPDKDFSLLLYTVFHKRTYFSFFHNSLK